MESVKSHGRNFLFFHSECNLQTKMALEILNGVLKNCKIK